MVPPPQATEQAVQARHAPTSQSTGQWCTLHFCNRFKVGHAAPPCAASTTIDRVDICTPLPHDLVQPDHDDHVLTWQSTAQGRLLHDRDSSSDGHAVPPLRAGRVTERLRDWMPPPQVAEQPPTVQDGT